MSVALQQLSPTRLIPKWLTGHRAVVLALVALVVSALAAAGFGSDFPYTPTELLASLLISVVATGASTYLFAALVRVPPGADSWLITGLILFFLMPGVSDAAGALSVTLAGVLASASKYLLAWRGRLIVNPAVAGAVIVYGLAYAGVSFGELSLATARWWIADASLIWPMVVIGALLVTVLREWRLVSVFIAASLLTVGIVHLFQGGQTLQMWVVSSPMLFLAAVMLPEPLTSPGTRVHRMIYGVLVGVLMHWQQTFAITDGFTLSFIPEIALLFGCLYASAVRLVAQRGAGRDTLEVATDAIAAGTYRVRDVSLSAAPHFVPGQWALLSDPHWSAPVWQRTRRVLSFASAPGAPSEFGFTVSGDPSTFKAGLIDGKTTRLRLDAVGGDFTLPSTRGNSSAPGGRGPVVLLASGIGITPYRSKLAALTADEGVDLSWLRVIHVVKVPQRRVYSDILDAARTAGATVTVIASAELVVGEAGTGQWRDILGEQQAGARYFLSGNPDFITATTAELRNLDRSLHWQRWRIHTDAFFGY